MKEIIKPAFNDNYLAVVIFVDNNYAPFTGITIYSLIQNYSKDANCDILLFQNSFTQHNLQKVKRLSEGHKNISIRIYDMNEFSGILQVETGEGYHLSSYAKVFSMSSVFDAYERVLTLDSDTVVLLDISALKDIDFEGKPIAAVKDMYASILVKRNFHTDKRFNYMPLKKYFDLMEIDENNYFNAGVMMYDLVVCRKYSYYEKILDMSKKNPKVMYDEQDIFNIMFKNNWKKLKIQWNAMSPYSIIQYVQDFPKGYKDAVRKAAIIHFVGRNKPWEDERAYYRDIYMKYAIQTEWYNDVLKAQELFEERQKVKHLFLSKGSRSRLTFYRLKYKINDMLHGW